MCRACARMGANFRAVRASMGGSWWVKVVDAGACVLIGKPHSLTEAWRDQLLSGTFFVRRWNPGTSDRRSARNVWDDAANFNLAWKREVLVRR